MAVAVLDLAGLQALIDVLRGRGYRVVGPTERDGALVLAEITDVAALPAGTGDDQQPGRYRTRERTDGALFGYAATAQSAKPWLLPPDVLLWRGTRQGAGFSIEQPDGEPVPTALLGLRGCDLAAISVQDRVLRDRPAADADYAARRAATFLVAVTCGTPAETCFCASMGTGPRPGEGADLTLTELLDGEHRFLAEAGSPDGQQVLAELSARPAAEADLTAAEAVVADAVARMGRSLQAGDLRGLLYASAESPRWDDLAARCLACTNCTAVCPTCFCTSVEDVSDLSGDVDERHRVWDSCFSWEYSRLHGGAVRTWTGSRYRQWLTHKLAGWVDQFGVSGCVGCGRCIAWCPDAIDLTAEVAALSGDAAQRAASTRAVGSER